VRVYVYLSFQVYALREKVTRTYVAAYGQGTRMATAG
jgi:hypothetical protein